MSVFNKQRKKACGIPQAFFRFRLENFWNYRLRRL